MKVTTMVEKEIDVKIIRVHAKVTDTGNYDLIDAEGTIIKSAHEDYVPSFFPGDHYGDYLIFEIDIETGKILNWKKPSSDQIGEYLDEK